MSLSFVAGSYGEVYRGEWHGTVGICPFTWHICSICNQFENFHSLLNLYMLS